MEVLDVFPESLDVFVDGVRCDAPDLDQSVVLYEDCVASEVAVYDWLLNIF